jgi:hypothetical protein
VRQHIQIRQIRQVRQLRQLIFLKQVRQVLQVRQLKHASKVKQVRQVRNQLKVRQVNINFTRSCRHWEVRNLIVRKNLNVFNQITKSGCNIKNIFKHKPK